MSSGSKPQMSDDRPPVQVLPGPEFVCYQCKLVFVKAVYLLKHVVSVHGRGQKEYRCVYSSCSVTLKSLEGLHKHLQCHEGMSRYGANHAAHFLNAPNALQPLRCPDPECVTAHRHFLDDLKDYLSHCAIFHRDGVKPCIFVNCKIRIKRMDSHRAHIRRHVINGHKFSDAAAGNLPSDYEAVEIELDSEEAALEGIEEAADAAVGDAAVVHFKQEGNAPDGKRVLKKDVKKEN